MVDEAIDPAPQVEPLPDPEPQEPAVRDLSALAPITFINADRSAKARVFLDLRDVAAENLDEALTALLELVDPHIELPVCLLSHPPFGACARRGIVFELIPDDSCLGSADPVRNQQYREAKRELVERKWAPARHLFPA